MNKVKLPDKLTGHNPFDYAYLGQDTPEDPVTAQISLRLPKRLLEIAAMFAADTRLPFDHNMSAVLRAGIMKYLWELSAQHDTGDLAVYLQSMARLRRNAFAYRLQYEIDRHIGFYAAALNNAMKRGKTAAVHEILDELRIMYNTAPAPEWRTDFGYALATSKPVQEAVAFLVDKWSFSKSHNEASFAREWFDWWEKLQTILAGGGAEL